MSLRLIFIVTFVMNPGLFAKELKMFTFGGNNATTSSEVLLMLEEVVRAKSEDYKIISIKEGIGFRYQSDYYIPVDPDELIAPFSNEKILDTGLLNKKIGKLDKTAQVNEVYESGRAILVMTPETPPEFAEAIAAKRHTISKLNSNTRFWNDLKNYKVKSYLNSENSVEKFSFNNLAWHADKIWKLALFKEYVIQNKNKFFSVKVIPKAFGGLGRFFTAARQNLDSESVVVSSGNLLGDDNERWDFFESFFKDFKNAYVIAGGVEVEIAGGRFSDEKLRGILVDRVISYNLCELREKECVKLFKPFVTINSGGLKVAVVGLTSPEIQSDIDKLAATTPTLKNVRAEKPKTEDFEAFLFGLRKNHDLIVLATNMSAAYAGENYSELLGSDLLLFRSNRKFFWEENSELNIKNYAERFPLHALQRVDISTTYGQLFKISKKDKDLQINSHRLIFDQSQNSGAEFNDVYTRSLVENFFKMEFILPDHKELFRDKLVADRTEFAKMSAQLLKRRFNAEVGIFNEQPQNTTVVGPQEERGVRTWIRNDDYVEVLYLKGDELKRLYQFNQDLRGDDKLAFNGLSSDLKINGLSVNDREYYRVVLPKTIGESRQYSIKSALLADKFVKLSDGSYQDSENGQPMNLADFIIGYLKEFWKSYNQEVNVSKKAELTDIYKKLYKGEAIDPVEGYWTHSLDNLSLEYSQLTTTDASAFSSVTDSRLKTVDQRYIAASFNFKSSFKKSPFVNELGLSARYSKQEVLPSSGPSVVTILDDQIRAYANASLPVYSLENYDWLGREMGPYTEISYETEFEAEPGLSLQKNLTGFAGWKVFSGDFIKSASVFALINKYMTDSNPRTVTGAGFKFEASKQVFTDQAEYKINSEYRYFFDDDDPVADIRSRLVFDQSFNLNITDKISFGPYFRYFSLTRKSLNETVSQNVIGVNLTYSDFWKPKYRTP